MLFIDCHKQQTPPLLYSSHLTIMVLQLEQIPEGAVAINDGEEVKENREASETGSCYLRQLLLLYLVPLIINTHSNLHLIFQSNTK